MADTASFAEDQARKLPVLQEFKLEEDQELRFEVTGNEVVVELLEGRGEIFGSELVQHKRYVFPTGCRVAIFTWHGCSVEVVGETEGAYIAKQTPMIIYLNTHAALEMMRQNAEDTGGRGPRLMIVGPTDVGKSTYCRILLNYAVRMGRCPTFVDLDVGQGQISVPGTIGALFVERPADAAEGFERRMPLVYSFGHLSPGENIPLFNMLVSKLAETVSSRCQMSKAASASGIIINTCGWIKGDGYTCLVKAAETFEVDVVVVIDHERLYNELKRDLPDFVKIVHQPKSGGVEERSRELRVTARRSKIYRYFYGGLRHAYFPHSFQVRFDEVSIFKIGAPTLPDSCMPLGMKAEDTRTKLVPMQPNLQMQHHLMALSLCESINEDILCTNVAGFLCITEVCIERQTMTVLSPQPYPLPRRILIWTDITFMDIH